MHALLTMGLRRALRSGNLLTIGLRRDSVRAPLTLEHSRAWTLLTLEPHRHWLYHGLENVQVEPAAHRKLPEYDWPPQGWYLA